MLDFVKRYGRNIFSQNGENGIIDEVLTRIGKDHGTAIEFGAPSREYCSNINHLLEWNLWFYDVNPFDPYVHRKEITPDNVNELPRCDLLSIDIDGNDYEVWKAYKGTPDIVVIEINSSLPPMSKWFSTDKGSSYITMLLLGLEKGYFLLAHTGNLIFVRGERRGLFPEVVGDGLSNWEEYFNKSWL